MENVIRHCNWKLNLKLVSFTRFLFSQHICHFVFHRSIAWFSFRRHVVPSIFFFKITTIFVFAVALFVIDIPDCEIDSVTCRVKWTFFSRSSAHCTHEYTSQIRPIRLWITNCNRSIAQMGYRHKTSFVDYVNS